MREIWCNWPIFTSDSWKNSIIRQYYVFPCLLLPFVLNVDCFTFQNSFTKSIKGTTNWRISSIWFYHVSPLPSQLQSWVMDFPFITFNKVFYEMPNYVLNFLNCKKVLYVRQVDELGWTSEEKSFSSLLILSPYTKGRFVAWLIKNK